MLILGRRLVLSQWVALLLLFCGTVAATDLSSSSRRGTESGNVREQENPVLGLTAVLVAALLSSSSSVYFEMMLKQRLLWRGGGLLPKGGGETPCSSSSSLLLLIFCGR